jgi:hypothetical protein
MPDEEPPAVDEMGDGPVGVGNVEQRGRRENRPGETAALAGPAKVFLTEPYGVGAVAGERNQRVGEPKPQGEGSRSPQPSPAPTPSSQRSRTGDFTGAKADSAKNRKRPVSFAPTGRLGPPPLDQTRPIGSGTSRVAPRRRRGTCPAELRRRRGMSPAGPDRRRRRLRREPHRYRACW